MYKFEMDSIPFLVVAFVCKILASQTLAWDENSLSGPVITRNHRRLKGFTFNTFHSASLVSCGLQCQRNPRCVSTNFRKISSLEKTKGICELNERGAVLQFEEKELEHDEESVYAEFYDMKHDCQLTGCLNAGSCTSTEESKVFKCKCQGDWCGNYCGVRPTPVGMESGAILDSWISASSEYSAILGAHLARLHLKRTASRYGGWAALYFDYNQWLQVDLQQTTRVTGIATQGREDWPQWVTEYKLQYGEDGHTFTFYKRIGDHADTVFLGNTDTDTVVSHELNPIIKARYIRVRPTQWYQRISMRMELYTC
ncbi:retinoschisin-like [Oculina patagonica]